MLNGKRQDRPYFDDAGKKLFESPALKESKFFTKIYLNQKKVKYSQQIPGLAYFYKINAQQCTPEQYAQIQMRQQIYQSIDQQLQLTPDQNNEAYHSFRKFVFTIDCFRNLNQDQEKLNQYLNIKIKKVFNVNEACVIFDKLCQNHSQQKVRIKNFSEEELQFFIWLVYNYIESKQKGFLNLDDEEWQQISKMVPGKNAETCKQRWFTLLRSTISDSKWKQEEDDLIKQLYEQYKQGDKKWTVIAAEVTKLSQGTCVRNAKQCRERWLNHINPQINKGEWTDEEDVQLMNLFLEKGKKWAEISRALETRSETQIKNRFKSLIKKFQNEMFKLQGTSPSTDDQSPENINYKANVFELEKRIAQLMITKKSELSDTSSDKTKILYLRKSQEDQIFDDQKIEQQSEQSQESNSIIQKHKRTHQRSKTLDNQAKKSKDLLFSIIQNSPGLQRKYSQNNLFQQLQQKNFNLFEQKQEHEDSIFSSAQENMHIIHEEYKIDNTISNKNIQQQFQQQKVAVPTKQISLDLTKKSSKQSTKYIQSPPFPSQQFAQKGITNNLASKLQQTKNPKNSIHNTSFESSTQTKLAEIIVENHKMVEAKEQTLRNLINQNTYQTTQIPTSTNNQDQSKKSLENSNSNNSNNVFKQVFEVQSSRGKLQSNQQQQVIIKSIDNIKTSSKLYICIYNQEFQELYIGQQVDSTSQAQFLIQQLSSLKQSLHNKKNKKQIINSMENSGIDILNNGNSEIINNNIQNNNNNITNNTNTNNKMSVEMSQNPLNSTQSIKSFRSFPRFQDTHQSTPENLMSQLKIRSSAANNSQTSSKNFSVCDQQSPDQFINTNQPKNYPSQGLSAFSKKGFDSVDLSKRQDVVIIHPPTSQLNLKSRFISKDDGHI